MDKDTLIRNLNRRYCSKREMLPRLPLGVHPDELWQELLKSRQVKSVTLPLYTPNGSPYWYVTTERMISASEKIVETLYADGADFDPYTEPPPVVTLEEAFFTSYVEGAQITMQAAMDFLVSGDPPRDIEEQMIANNRMAGKYAAENLYRGIDSEFLRGLAYLLTDGMDSSGQDYRTENNADHTSVDGECFSFPSPIMIPSHVDAFCGFLASPQVHPLIKAGVAQGYLFALRPFPEGNDRLGRILSSMILLRAGYTFFSDVSLSALIARRSYAYYEATANILREENGGDMTYFLEFFLELLSRAVDERALRQQRREDQSLQIEQEMARTALTVSAIPPPVSTQNESVEMPPQPPEQPDLQPAAVEAPDAKESDLLDGFFTVPAQEPVSEVKEKSKEQIRELLAACTASSGKNLKVCAKHLLEFIDQGKYVFSQADIGKHCDLDSKQLKRVLFQIKEKGIIKSCNAWDGRYMLYRFNADLPLSQPTSEDGSVPEYPSEEADISTPQSNHPVPALTIQDYAPDVVEAIQELQSSTVSQKDQRIGTALQSCLSRGVITDQDYARYGSAAKMPRDMQLAEWMGIVEKISANVYRINRHRSDRLPKIAGRHRKLIALLYRHYAGGWFSLQDASSVSSYAPSTISGLLHRLIHLHAVERTERSIYKYYRLMINPMDHPCFFDVEYVKTGELSKKDEPQFQHPAPEPPEIIDGPYSDEFYAVLNRLDTSDSEKDNRLSGMLRRNMKKGFITMNDYAERGYSSSVWFKDMELAVVLGLVYVGKRGFRTLNRTLDSRRNNMQPNLKKTVTEIYEAFGNQIFTSEMFVATVKYSETHSYASLHKLTLMRVVDLRKTEDGNQYHLLVNPEDNPECFDQAA